MIYLQTHGAARYSSRQQNDKREIENVQRLSNRNAAGRSKQYDSSDEVTLRSPQRQRNRAGRVLPTIQMRSDTFEELSNPNENFEFERRNNPRGSRTKVILNKDEKSSITPARTRTRTVSNDLSTEKTATISSRGNEDRQRKRPILNNQIQATTTSSENSSTKSSSARGNRFSVSEVPNTGVTVARQERRQSVRGNFKPKAPKQENLEDENYPEHFKALIKSKQPLDSKESNAIENLGIRNSSEDVSITGEISEERFTSRNKQSNTRQRESSPARTVSPRVRSKPQEESRSAGNSQNSRNNLTTETNVNIRNQVRLQSNVTPRSKQSSTQTPITLTTTVAPKNSRKTFYPTRTRSLTQSVKVDSVAAVEESAVEKQQVKSFTNFKSRQSLPATFSTGRVKDAQQKEEARKVSQKQLKNTRSIITSTDRPTTDFQLKQLQPALNRTFRTTTPVSEIVIMI